MLSFLTSPTFFWFYLLQKFFPNLIARIPTPLSFIVLLFQYCCFQLIFPMASQKSQQDRASRKQCYLLPTYAILITSVTCRSTDWYLLKYKQTHLPCCSELECGSYCNPPTDRIIAQDWFIGGVFLKQVENALSLIQLVSRLCTDSSCRDHCITCKQGLLLRIVASCSYY